MTKSILIVWSSYYKDLAERQLEICVNKLKRYEYNYHIETVEAGIYEIPTVIQHYHCSNPFDAYLPLSLLLKIIMNLFGSMLKNVLLNLL